MRTFSKILSAFLAVTMLLGCWVFTASAQTSGDVWNGTPDTSWYETAKDTTGARNITINTPAQLAGLSVLAADGETFEGWTVTLGADLYFNTGEAADWATTAPANVWTPIATFKGTFDGAGHVISGLYLDSSSTNYVGLFSHISGATIRDVSVVNSYFNAGQVIGSIAAESKEDQCTISGCYSDAIIKSNVTIGTDTSVDRSLTGGILGAACSLDSETQKGTIINNCWFAGSIVASSNKDNKATRVGGIVGGVEGKDGGTVYPIHVSDCLVTGYISAQNQMGGIVGSARKGTASVPSTIENSLMLGDINVTRNNATVFVGQFTTCTSDSVHLNMTNVYGEVDYGISVLQTPTYYGWENASIGTNKTNLTFKITAGTVTKTFTSYLAASTATDQQKADFDAINAVGKLSIAQMTGDNAKSNIAGFDFVNTWSTVANSTPVLKSLADEAAGNYVKTSADEVYDGNAEAYSVTLTTPAQFAGLSVLATDGENFEGWNIKLGADLYFNTGLADEYDESANSWTPIAAFNGILDGQGYSLNGLYCNLETSDCAALINTLSGSVKNLSVLNSYFYGCKNVATIAAIAKSGARVSEIYTDAYLYSVGGELTTSSNSGGIIGEAQTGGCLISECQFSGILEVSGKSEFAQKVGGILGCTPVSVSISDCLVTGTVVASYQIGGIVGVAQNYSNVTLNNCVFLGKLVSTRGSSPIYLGSIVGTTWKSDLTVTMTNCYHDVNYSAIYTAESANKDYATSYYTPINPSGTSNIVIDDSGCGTISAGSAQEAVSAMGGAWEYSANKFPMLKTVNERFTNTKIFGAEVQINETENSFRIVAGVKGIELEDYTSVSYKIEVVTSDGTLKNNDPSSVVYSSLIVDNEPKTAQDYQADYLYIKKVTGFDNGAKITLICTPMLTHKDGQVISGTPEAFVFSFAD